MNEARKKDCLEKAVTPWLSIEELEQLTDADAGDIARCLAAERVPSRARDDGETVFESVAAEDTILRFQRNKIGGGDGGGITLEEALQMAQRAIDLAIIHHKQIAAMAKALIVAQEKISKMDLPPNAAFTICLLIDEAFSRAAKIGEEFQP